MKGKMEISTAALNSGENGEIREYRIHVSSKYLELTKEKLELTRLPHEVLLPRPREWELGTPKEVLEGLVDFWLERYTWRTREETLNKTLPQFRTAISLPSSKTPLRIHFLHLRSPHANAIPLLLLPPFPLTNLSLPSSLLTQLTNPNTDNATTPSFHIVCPSLPGLGFSDAFPDSESNVEDTAYLFNTLMLRLGYEEYLCSSTGPGRNSPAGVDFRLVRAIGERFGGRCKGVHLIDPCVEMPTIGRGLWSWVKFWLAGFCHAGIWGYDGTDWRALKASSAKKRTKNTIEVGERRPLLNRGAGYGAIAALGLREPTTLSYALCDSPVGMLSLICSALQKTSPGHKLTETQIIDITQLAWLPGPEAGMRFWSAASASQFQREAENGRGRRKRVKMAVTVFNVDGADPEAGYVCPAWVAPSNELVFAQRLDGRAGLTIWERSEVLVEGIRGLASAVDGFRIRDLEEVVVAGEEGVIVEVEEVEEEDEDEDESHGMQLDVESPDTVVAVDMSD